MGLPRLLILGGVHGDEVEGVVCAQELLLRLLGVSPMSLELALVPALNWDGFVRKTRVNSNGVDLNRNLATNDWSPQAFNERYPPGEKANSETENQALVQFLEQFKPDLVISLHSWKPLLNTNGNCEPWASLLSKRTGYVIEESIGYPTPGCLGTYAGIERGWPTITYEIERGSSLVDIRKIHVEALLELIEKFSSAEKAERSPL